MVEQAEIVEIKKYTIAIAGQQRFTKALLFMNLKPYLTDELQFNDAAGINLARLSAHEKTAVVIPRDDV